MYICEFFWDFRNDFDHEFVHSLKMGKDSSCPIKSIVNENTKSERLKTSDGIVNIPHLHYMDNYLICEFFVMDI